MQLLELYARSVMLLHLGRSEEWVDLFLPTATYRCVRAGPDSRVEQFQGRPQLLDLARGVKAGQLDVAVGKINPSLRCRHHLSNITLFNDGTHGATGYAYLAVTNVAGPEPPRWIASGLYSDRLCKCPTGWFFETRTFTPDGA